jgi:hypothetical protein
MKKYSEMTEEELHTEMQRLLQEGRRKQQAGFPSEANILEQKFYMVKSYLKGPKEILCGQEYHVIGEEGLFKVRYLNGVFAWGKFSSSKEEVGFPIGRLEKGGSYS